jgi:hypothetical protein
MTPTKVRAGATDPMPSNKGVIEELMKDAFDAHNSLVDEVYRLSERLSPVLAPAIEPTNPPEQEEPENPGFVLRVAIKKLIRHQEMARKVVIDVLARLEI